MLDELFPRVHRRYTSLPVLGARLTDFARWLVQEGYPRNCVRCKIRTTRRIEETLRGRGINTFGEITREQLRACLPLHSSDASDLAGTVRSLEHHLEVQGLLPPLKADGHTEILLNSYAAHLHDVRGLARRTVAQHRSAAGRFLLYLGYEEDQSHLLALAAADIERFIRTNGQRVCRAYLQHVVARLRSFLRFLAMSGSVVPGLEAQIDTPRLYRGEQLPHSLPWEMVHRLLTSIDRASRCGLRDYAIFLLIVTYGLRASEIVSLTIDDIDWRAGRIRISQQKTKAPLILPLTDEVGASLIQYLQEGRPALPCREIFLRERAPAGTLKATAINNAFKRWARASGLNISFQGPHCLRHSYAVNLLRKGTSLKTIGDILGHQTAESTCVYIRLAVEDLRDVALPLPNAPLRDAGCEEKP